METWIKPEKLSEREGGMRDNERGAHMGLCDFFSLPVLFFPFWINNDATYSVLFLCIILFPLSDSCIYSQALKDLKCYSFHIHQILHSSPLETWTFNHLVYSACITKLNIIILQLLQDRSWTHDSSIQLEVPDYDDITKKPHDAQHHHKKVPNASNIILKNHTDGTRKYIKWVNFFSPYLKICPYPGNWKCDYALL